MTPSPDRSDREIREAVAKLAEIVRVLAQSASAFGDLEMWIRHETESARIAQSLREQTQEERDA